ncbi:hypothetical protein AK812_SmicGene13069, partial [Symbiodinium microadriaticum]
MFHRVCIARCLQVLKGLLGGGPQSLKPGVTPGLRARTHGRQQQASAKANKVRGGRSESGAVASNWLPMCFRSLALRSESMDS